jgi:hypothetical protein
LRWRRLDRSQRWRYEIVPEKTHPFCCHREIISQWSNPNEAFLCHNDPEQAMTTCGEAMPELKTALVEQRDDRKTMESLRTL